MGAVQVAASCDLMKSSLYTCCNTKHRVRTKLGVNQLPRNTPCIIKSVVMVALCQWGQDIFSYTDMQNNIQNIGDYSGFIVVVY